MTQSLNVGVGGAWKTAKPYVGVSGAWKPVQAAWVGAGGVWKQFYTAALNVVVSGGQWFDFGDGTFNATFSASASNGVGPYTYAWTNVGTTSPVFSTFAGFSVNFSGPGFPGPLTMQCKITDANGLVGIGTGTVTL